MRVPLWCMCGCVGAMPPSHAPGHSPLVCVARFAAAHACVLRLYARNACRGAFVCAHGAVRRPLRGAVLLGRRALRCCGDSPPRCNLLHLLVRRGWPAVG